MILQINLLLLLASLVADVDPAVVVFTETYKKPVVVRYMTRAYYIGRTITLLVMNVVSSAWNLNRTFGDRPPVLPALSLSKEGSVSASKGVL